jgi:hypothetical protein
MLDLPQNLDDETRNVIRSYTYLEILQKMRSSLYERDLEQPIHGHSKEALIELLDKAVHRQAVRTTRLIHNTTKVA